MAAPSAAPRLLYRSTRLLRMAFQQLHQQQQRADDFCDVVLQAEGEVVVAHCCILSVCSPFFMEQLSRELPPRGRRVVLELGGLKIRVLRKLVRFLYTAELEATQEEVQEVLAAARRLRVTELESLQLQGGRLVRLGPQRHLNRSCLRTPQQGSPVLAGGGAEPSSAGTPPGSTSSPPSLSRVGRVRLRKMEGGGCWEVVRERQPPAAVGDGGVTELQPPLGVDALERGGRCSLPQVAWRQQVLPTPQQCCKQGVPPGAPPDNPEEEEEEEEEVDVGVAGPCLPPGTVCVRPCPSESEEEEVDILT